MQVVHTNWFWRVLRQWAVGSALGLRGGRRCGLSSLSGKTFLGGSVLSGQPRGWASQSPGLPSPRVLSSTTVSGVF